MDNSNSVILIDSHVHIYDCYDEKIFFDSAFRNFAANAREIAGRDSFKGVLFLTESRGYNYFEKYFDDPGLHSDIINYKIERTGEDTSLTISDNKNIIILVSGQQIITSENLEVLSVGTRKKFADNKSIDETINLIRNEGALPVVPWGVGKWTGKRGKVIKKILNNCQGFFLGDNSGRPFFWNTPALFIAAVQKNIFTLRGTDPLPVKCQEKKVGSFGFYFLSGISSEKPCEDLKKYLNEMNKQPGNYGKLESLDNFLKNQFSMQFNKLKKNQN